MTDEAVKRISAAFVVFLAEKLGKKEEELVISVGHDSRISAERIKSDVIDALSFFGLEIKGCALASTPAMFMTTKMLGCDGAVQITASHHPWDRNGLKFFTPDGGLSGDEIKSILEYAEEHESGSCPERLNLQEVDFMSVYCEHLCNMIRNGVKSDDYERPLKGLKIVVDAGNGVGGFYAEKVLSPRSGHNRQPLFGAGRYVPQPYPESRKRDGDELRARGNSRRESRPRRNI